MGETYVSASKTTLNYYFFKVPSKTCEKEV
jgi:hypothetical protein